MANERVAVLENGLEVWRLDIATLKEQDINAQVMDDRKMKILTANIKTRGALESLPYVYKDGDVFSIVSGHHRVRAANEAGLKTVFGLVETNKLTKSQIVSKQIAHNELVGEADNEVLGELIKQMQDVDDMIASGLPDKLLKTAQAEAQVIDIPQLTFDWRVVNLTFLPKQLKDFETLVKSVDNKADFVGVAERKQYDDFCNTMLKYGKTRNVKSIGTVITLLTELALKEIEKWEKEQKEEDQAST